MIHLLNKELKTYFYSGTGFIFMAIFLLLFGVYFTYLNILPIPNNNFIATLNNMLLIFILLVPILTMRSLADEMKTKTDQLLFTSPQSLPSIVVGKFFAAQLILLITLFITIGYAFILSLFGAISVAKIISAYIGFFFMGSSFIAMGIFISSTTKSVVSAGVISLGLFLFTWLLGVILPNLPVSSQSSLIFLIVTILLIGLLIYITLKNIFIPLIIAIGGLAIVVAFYLINSQLYVGLIPQILRWLALSVHFNDFNLGILNGHHLIYYLSITIVFIFLTVRVLEKKRWS